MGATSEAIGVPVRAGDVPFLTVEGAAERAGVSCWAVRDWLTTGVLVRAGNHQKRIALRGRKVGQRWRILPADLDHFLRAMEAASVSPNALPVPGDGETPAQKRKRGEEAQRRAAKALGGE